jgi:hypothetical protein
MVLLALPALAQAQVTAAAGYTPPDDTQSIKVGALIFYDYTYTKTPMRRAIPCRSPPSTWRAPIST